MISNYPAVFIKNGNGYIVDFPDFECLATEGGNLDHAIAMATDVLALRVFYASIDKYELPKASDVNSFDLQAVKNEYEMPDSEAFVNIISVDADEYANAHFIKYVHKNVTLPDWLEQRAKERKINFTSLQLCSDGVAELHFHLAIQSGDTGGNIQLLAVKRLYLNDNFLVPILTRGFAETGH